MLIINYSLSLHINLWRTVTWGLFGTVWRGDCHWWMPTAIADEALGFRVTMLTKKQMKRWAKSNRT